MKTTNLLIALAFAGTFCISCTQDDSFSTPSQETAGENLFKFSLPTRSGDKAGGIVSSLHAYAFSEGNYLRKFENINVTTDNFQLSLPADKQKKLFFLANHTPLTINNESTFSEAEALKSVSSAATATPPEVSLYAKVSAGTSTTENVDISLIRGVARIDINPGTDNKMSIDSIGFTGGADRTYLFSDTPADIPADAAGVVYKKKYDTPLAGGAVTIEKQEVFYVYENGSKEANITVYGKYNGIDIEVKAKAPSMTRNKIYTIKLQNVGQVISGTIDITPWGTGDDIIATPDI